jgi:ABC-type branched-subunit amino acid transport system ATPase component
VEETVTEMREPRDAPASSDPWPLSADGVVKTFGDMRAVDGISLTVAPAAVTGLIGANGAGKTTMLNLLSGVLRADAGTVELHGRDVTRARAAARARRGLARTFQHPRLVPNLSCLENVMLGAQVRDSGARELLSFARGRKDERRLAERAAEALEATGLPAPSWLSYPGEVPPQDHRWVELARAVVGEPDVLLLDEPNSGFTAAENERLVASLSALRDGRGMAIVLVTHDVSLAMRLCARIAVMHHGKRIAWGTPDAVISDPDVVSAYLGKKGREVAVATLDRLAG